MELLEGTPKETISASKENNENYKINIKVEDDVKVKLKILKKEAGTDTVLQGAKFKIYGKGFSSNGKTVATNMYGEAIIKGLAPDVGYYLEETKAPEGYYIGVGINFVIENVERSWYYRFRKNMYRI